MSRKKILIPLAKRHTHHRTLALVQRSESVTSEGVDKAFWVDAVVLVLGRARKRFKPSSRRWICPSLPDVAASRAEHLFESENVKLLAQVWRLSRWAWDKATAFSGTAFIGGVPDCCSVPNRVNLVFRRLQRERNAFPNEGEKG